ncbi:galactofuranosyltransferase [Striga asiatica]|uniref:Galactofuranosyltransferase n=1 Tax=Striga asiatica TaxID=4170 RepID=A0A5A7PUS2_STRAF|nr:galactofuranosyltransferase [Striga asiatica]
MVSPQFEPPRLFKDGPTIPAWRLSPATSVFPAKSLVGLGFEEAGCGRRTRSSDHFLAASSMVGDFLVIMMTAERFSDIQDVGEVAYCGAPVKQSSWMKMSGRSQQQQEQDS